jgi:maleylpyruvate isomerase
MTGRPGDQTRTDTLPDLDETVYATTRYLQALTGLDDESVRRASVLPGWTRAHVVTHLARNADAIAHALHGARSGADAWMYASQESRDADVEAGAHRPAADLRADAAASWRRLREALDDLDAAHLDAPVSRVPGQPAFPARDLVGMRRTEVEVHHADLDLGYTPADWPVGFCTALVERRQDEFAQLPGGGPSMMLCATDVDRSWRLGEGQGPEVHGTAGELAWWLVGRGGRGLTCSAGQLPTIGRWR